MTKGPVVEKRRMTALRIPEAQLEEIKARASEARISFTEYMIRCALGEAVTPGSIDERMVDLERRMDRLEARADLSM